MRTVMPNTRRSAYYTVRGAAWILGVEPSTISCAIRLGILRTVRRHGRLVVPASALTRLLGKRTDDRETSAATPYAAHSSRSGGARW